MERSPAVAGLFYPADPGDLRRTLDECLGPPVADTEPAIAVVVPHAGYVYSGRTAGRVYRQTPVPPVVVLLGPNHTGRGRPVAVWAGDSWRTPLGEVPVDIGLAEALLDSHPLFEADREAHRREHALEVQLPFLQALRPDLRLVAVTLADVGPSALLELGQALSRVLAGCAGDRLLVISSDMTHYESRETARRQDRLALERLQAVDAAGLYATVRDHRISMCGVVPATVGLAAAAALGARRGRLVDYSCSGDVTGDDGDVVAYAGLTIA